jgi:uncharacterized integral membrane protein
VFIVGILLAYLLIENFIPVSEVRIFGKSYYNQPLGLIMFYSFIFGLLVAGIFWLISEIRLRSELTKQKKENEAMLSELTKLRNLPFENHKEENKKEG